MKLILVVILFLSLSLSAQQTIELSPEMKQINLQVTKHNDELKFENSIQILSNFISNEKTSDYERYLAYTMKAYTYKRLFNYEETILNLDLALQVGLKTVEKESVTNIIKSEKAFVYFDIQEYEKAGQLMSEIAKSQYAYLPIENKSFIIMQEGYLLMMDGKYAQAEKMLDIAISLTEKSAPRNLPNLYGKKIELYDKMKLYDKRDAAFKKGLEIADQYDVIKYKLYLYEVMRNLYQANADYKNAFETQKKYDSLDQLYNANSSNGKIQILEREIVDKQLAHDTENERIFKYILLALIVILSLLLLGSYWLYKTNKERRILVEKENVRIYLDIERLTKEIDEKGNGIDLNKYNLTERQMQIIELIKQGKSNRDIGSTLFISENTVKYHLKIIYEILDIDHRLELSK